MKKVVVIALGFLSLSVLALILPWPDADTNLDSSAGVLYQGESQAAFRDGHFCGRLAAKHGKLHVSSARWSSETDRRAFVAGYMQGYADSGGSVVILHVAEKAGYRHGMEDGEQDRDSGRRFRMRDKPTWAGDSALASLAYREAYASGYQLAYYGNQGGADAFVIWPVLSPGN